MNSNRGVAQTARTEANKIPRAHLVAPIELPSELVPRLRSVAYTDGIPPRAQVYADAIRAELQSFEVV